MHLVSLVWRFHCVDTDWTLLTFRLKKAHVLTVSIIYGDDNTCDVRLHDPPIIAHNIGFLSQQERGVRAAADSFLVMSFASKISDCSSLVFQKSRHKRT